MADAAKDIEQGDVRHNASKTHGTNDTEAHDVLGHVVAGEEVGTVDLSQITHGVDESKGDAADLVGHGYECDGCIGKRQRVRRPDSGRHDDKQCVACFVAVDGTDNDGAQHGHGQPAAQDESAESSVPVGKVTRNGRADEGNEIDRDGHVLRVAGSVAEAKHKCRVEVGERGGTNDSLVAMLVSLSPHHFMYDTTLAG